MMTTSQAEIDTGATALCYNRKEATNVTKLM